MHQPRMTKILELVGGWGIAIGGAFLIGIMVVITVNIISRRFGLPIVGTYEYSEYLIVVTISFALPYTALKGGHVAIDILGSRLPQRAQAIMAGFDSVIGIGTLWVMAWAAMKVIDERWIHGPGEYSELCDIPLLPLRCCWIFGLLLFSLVLLTTLVNTVRKPRAK